MVLNSVTGSSILSKMWWLDNTINSPNSYFSSEAQKKATFPGPLVARWDYVIEFWLVVLASSEVNHIQNWLLTVLHNL